jgi:predicted enzyme related to lactoylglutathione lyase
MRTSHIFPNLRVPDIEAARDFYVDFLGLTTEDFNLGWVARFTSPDTGANVQLVTRDATSPEDSVISVATADIDNAYEEAHRLGYEIVHPLTTESWGVTRFLIRAPDGNVINIVNHRD